MRQLILWWIPFALVHFLIGLTRLFERDKRSFHFGPWAKSGMVNVALAAHAAVLISLLGGFASEVWGIPPILLGCWYGVYASFRFGYQYQDSKFSWFNGIIRRTVSASDICQVVMRKKEGHIVKINLVATDRQTTVRNDFPEVAGLLRRFAKDRGIPVTEDSLPWWSV